MEDPPTDDNTPKQANNISLLENQIDDEFGMHICTQ